MCLVSAPFPRHPENHILVQWSHFEPGMLAVALAFPSPFIQHQLGVPSATGESRNTVR